MTTQPHSPNHISTARRSETLRALLAQHGATLRRQATRHAPDALAAEDALQDACVQFLRHYNGPPGIQALAWMQLTTKRCAWAIGRRDRRRHHLDLHAIDDDCQVAGVPAMASEATDPSLVLERRAQHEANCARLSRLKTDERTALVLFAAGYSYGEVAKSRGWTYTKVNRCIAEGRAALRQRTGP